MLSSYIKTITLGMLAFGISSSLYSSKESISTQCEQETRERRGLEEGERGRKAGKSGQEAGRVGREIGKRGRKMGRKGREAGKQGRKIAKETLAETP